MKGFVHQKKTKKACTVFQNSLKQKGRSKIPRSPPDSDVAFIHLIFIPFLPEFRKYENNQKFKRDEMTSKYLNYHILVSREEDK